MIFSHVLNKKSSGVSYSWTSYFDNTKWAPRSGDASWNVGGWWDSVAKDDGRDYEAVILDPIGGWEVDLRPIVMRVTFDGNFDVPGVLQQAYVWEPGNLMFSGLDIESLDIISVEAGYTGAGDIWIWGSRGEYNEDAYKITNIEFAES